MLTIGGAPFDPARHYRTAVYQFLLTGMNSIEPLLRHVDAHVRGGRSARATARPLTPHTWELRMELATAAEALPLQ